MKNIFKKSNLPFLKDVMHNGDRDGRDFWTLACAMKAQNGLQDQASAEIVLLSRGAQLGDPWSMCELARTYFYHCGDIFLPMALSMWQKAILMGDVGARYDISNLPIHERIIAYRAPDSDRYKEIEMICALLSQWHLTGLGAYSWQALDIEGKKARVLSLVKEACAVMEIPEVALDFVSGLKHGEITVDGLAHWEGKIELREETLLDYERVIEIVFHELGHIVAFEIMRGSERLKQIYGITDERIKSWERKDMGCEVTTSEEDPDTLSYGVYTLWATFFA